MEREKLLEEIADEFLNDRCSTWIEEVINYYRANDKEIIGMFTGVLQEGLDKCKRAEKEVKYIVISVLESGILTKKYDLQIAFFDHNMYLDEKAIYVYWIPHLIFTQIESDMDEYKKRASQLVTRIQKYEIERIRRRYVKNHYFIVFILLHDMIPRILRQEKEYAAILTEDVSVLFGKHMERPVLIYRKGK